jgi:putative acetyltransferase
LVVETRPETPEDLLAIHAVNQAAFGRPDEAELVDLCRAGGHAALSLVAVDGGRVVGHVLFTPLACEPARPGWHGLGLGPIAVLPELQGRRIGSQLIESGLELVRSQGWDFVVLLGDPGYYWRFGFIPGREFGLSSDYGEGDEFQARELRPGIFRGTRTKVVYVPEFKQAGC